MAYRMFYFYIFWILTIEYFALNIKYVIKMGKQILKFSKTPIAFFQPNIYFDFLECLIWTNLFKKKLPTEKMKLSRWSQKVCDILKKLQI